VTFADHLDRLIEQVAPGGGRVAQALRAVPCHLFVPPSASASLEGGGVRLIDRDTDPADCPRTIVHAPAGADVVIGALTGLRSTSDGGEDYLRVWVSDVGDPGRWAGATWEAGREEFEVYQIGDRPVWEEAVDAYFQWVAWGQPGRERFGMTVTAEGQQVWLDTPDRVIG
jgi:hypothetical protein